MKYLEQTKKVSLTLSNEYIEVDFVCILIYNREYVQRIQSDHRCTPTNITGTPGNTSCTVSLCSQNKTKSNIVSKLLSKIKNKPTLELEEGKKMS